MLHFKAFCNIICVDQRAITDAWYSGSCWGLQHASSVDTVLDIYCLMSSYFYYYVMKLSELIYGQRTWDCAVKSAWWQRLQWGEGRGLLCLSPLVFTVSSSSVVKRSNIMLKTTKIRHEVCVSIVLMCLLLL